MATTLDVPTLDIGIQVSSTYLSFAFVQVFWTKKLRVFNADLALITYIYRCFLPGLPGKTKTFQSSRTAET